MDQPSGLDALGVEHVPGHGLEPAGVGRGPTDRAPALAVVHGVPVVEGRLEEPEHAGHRGAQLVGDDGDELLLRLADGGQPLLARRGTPAGVG